MAEPKVSILLTLVDKLTAPVEGAKGKLASFGETVTGLGAKIAALGVSAALGAFFKSAIEEGIKAEQSYVRLGLSVKNAGGNFDALRPQLDSAVLGVTKLSTATDDDLNMALAQLISATGDVEGSMKNLGLVADVAAYKQISVQDAALLLGKAMAGNTKVFTEFGIIGGSVNERMDALRAVVGGFAENEANTLGGRLKNVNREWDEFKESVGMAIVGSDRLGGSVGGMTAALADLNGWMVKHQDDFVKFIDKIVAAGTAIVKVGGFIVEHTPNLYTASKAWDWLTGSTKATAVATTEAITVMGTATTNLRKLTDKEVEAIASVQENGAARISASQRAALMKVAGYIKEHGLLSIRLNKEQAEAIEAVVKESGRRRVDFAKTTAKQTEAVWTGSANVFKDAEKARAEAANEADAVIRSSWGVASGYIISETNKVVAAHRVQAAALATIIDGLDGVYGNAQKIPPVVKDVGDELRNGARGAISLASEMGVIDATAASVLNNVVNLSDSLKNGLAGISAGNLIGAIGSLAGILGSMFSDGPQEKARKELIQKNTQRLQELRDRMGELLNISTPGGKIAGFQGVSADELIASGFHVGPSGAKVGVGQIGQFLASKGLSITDMRDMAKEFGIDLGDDGKNFSIDGIRAFFGVLNSQQLTGFGPGLGGLVGRSDFLTGVTGGSAGDSLAGIGAALSSGSGSSALGGLFSGLNLGDGIDATEAAVIRQRTVGLAGRFAGGGVSAAEMGGASNAEFIAFIQRIIDLLGNIDSTNAVTANAVTSGGIGTVSDTDMATSFDLSTAAVGG